MHHTTTAWGGICLLALGLAIAGIVNQSKPERRLPGGLPIAIVLAVLSAFGLLAVVINETALMRRDDTMRARFASERIEMVEIDRNDDNLVIVKSVGCTAAFQIKQDADPDSWPLISGTGKAISGCKSKDLDKIFIRP